MKKGIDVLLLMALAANTAGAVAEKPWMTRARVEYIPRSVSNALGIVNGNKATAHAFIAPEVDVSYFFTNNIAMELALSGGRTRSFTYNTQNAYVDTGKVSILSTGLLAQYHVQANKVIKPYVGAGVGYLHYFNISNGPTFTNTRYSDSFLPVLQVGSDFNLNSQWLVNIDFKQSFISTNTSALSSGTYVNQKVKTTPWGLGFGMGYRFG